MVTSLYACLADSWHLWGTFQIESFNLLPDIVCIVCFVTRSILCQEDLVNHLFRLTALGVHWLYDFSFHPRLSTLESYGLRLVTPIMALTVLLHCNCCEDKVCTMLLGWSQNIVALCRASMRRISEWITLAWWSSFWDHKNSPAISY